MEDLVKTLKTFGDNIIKCEINFGKDSSSRKTKEYYDTKINSFQDLYRKFTDVEKEIVQIEPNHELDYRASILDKYEQFLNVLKQGKSNLVKPNAAAGIMEFVAERQVNTAAQQSTPDNANQLKLSLSKIDELEAELYQARIDLKFLSENHDAFLRENNDLKNSISNLNSQINEIDSIKFEKDSIESQFKALKLNFDRVSYEKRQLQITLNNSVSSISSTANQQHRSDTGVANNQCNSNKDDTLFTIKDIVKLIPKFSGNRTDLRVYINKCTELYSYVKHGGDQARFITVLKNNLSGDAALLLLDEDNLEDWDSIKDLLNQNFHSDPNHSNHIALMQSMKQKQEESVEDFSKRIKNILTKLKSSIPEGATKQFWFDHTERQAIQALEDGLFDVKLQSRVVSANKTSFNIASQYAIETENRLKSKQSNYAQSSKSNMPKVPNEFLFCRYCKKNNHLIENCKLRAKNNEKKGIKNEENNTEGASEGFKCTICNKNNHTTAICYKNPDNIGKSERTEKSASLNVLKTSDKNSTESKETEFQLSFDSDSEN